MLITVTYYTTPTGRIRIKGTVGNVSRGENRDSGQSLETQMDSIACTLAGHLKAGTWHGFWLDSVTRVYCRPIGNGTFTTPER